MNIENCTLLGLILISLASVPKGQAQTQVKVSTTLGEFTLELFETAAPGTVENCLLYTSPSPRDGLLSRMPSSA